MPMDGRKWLNQSQPQTLVIASFLLYFNAAFALLFGLSTGIDIGTLVVTLLGVLGAYGIANERKWGYYLAVAVAALPFVLRAALLKSHNPFRTDPLTLLFEIALLALLLHTQSREYEKVWFK